MQRPELTRKFAVRQESRAGSSSGVPRWFPVVVVGLLCAVLVLSMIVLVGQLAWSLLCAGRVTLVAPAEDTLSDSMVE